MARESRWDGPPGGIDRTETGRVIRRAGWPKWTPEQLRFADERKAALDAYFETGDRSEMVGLGLFNSEPAD